jgi:hypothetical protein
VSEQLWSPKPDSFRVHPRRIVKRQDPETSLAAAEKIDIDAQIWNVLQVIRTQGGARSLGGQGVTGDDLQTIFGIDDQRERKVAYSSVLGHVSTLEVQCYVERPGVKRVGHRLKNEQLVIWALTYEEREARLERIRKGLLELPDEETLRLLWEWHPLQEELDKLTERVDALKEQILDRYLPERPLGKHKALIERRVWEGLEREFWLQMVIKRYRNSLSIERKPR